MSILRQTRRGVRKLIYGDTDLPQEFTIGLTEPQALTTVWLHGLSAPLDVTQRYATACCAPLILGIGLDKEDAAKLSTMQNAKRSGSPRLSLQFREKTGEKRLLGELRLAPMDTIPCGESILLLCQVRSAANYCLPPIRRWAHFARLGWAE